MMVDLPPLAAIHFKNKRVLVADDMKLNQYIIGQLLTERGAELVTASDGLEALERCTEQPFDLILLDIRMPRLDGIEACRAIRKLNSPNALVPIVALTAHMFEEEQLNFFSIGMNAAVVKPVEPETFLPLLQRLLNSDADQDVLVVPPTTDSELKIDLSYLKQVGNNNAGFIAMMLSSFLQNADQLQQRLAMAVDTTDVKVIGEIAHQLKFSVGVLGVKALDEKLTWLQEQALITGVQDMNFFLVRSRRLQLKLTALVEQATELHRAYDQQSAGNT
jgi:CheY-like chemotaxis protein